MTALNQWNLIQGTSMHLAWLQAISERSLKILESHVFFICLDAKNAAKPIQSQHPSLLAILLVKRTAADSFLDTISESMFYGSVYQMVLFSFEVKQKNSILTAANSMAVLCLILGVNLRSV